MGDDEEANELAADTARSTVAPRSDRRRVVWRVLAVGGLILVIAGWYVIQRAGADLDDGFIAFRPDVSQFPAAPVADAHTDFGVGSPNGWPKNRKYCPYRVSDAFFAADVNTAWNSVRHDWVDSGEAKAWFISERTYAYKDRHLEDFDADLSALVQLTKYCGWQYDGYYAGFNSILTELDGLPDGAVAFTVGVAHQGDDSDRRFKDSDPEDFQALGAFIPGPKRGQAMNVFWTGWGTDVPRDQFVATVNALYDAAKAAPKPPAVVDDKTIEYSFVGFFAEQTGLFPDLGGGPAFEGADRLSDWRCVRDFRDEKVWEYADRTDYPPGGVDNRSRRVAFEAGRWRSRSRYAEAKRRVAPPAYRCIGSYQSPSTLIEPIDVPGLPEGAITWRWDSESGAYSIVLSDDEKQLMMTVTWRESSGTVPEDKLVDVVNRAWDRFQADNP